MTIRNQINDLNFLDEITREWLQNKLLTPGPWNNFDSLRKKVNSVLSFYLAGIESNHDCRGYLTDVDSDEIWIRCIKEHVVPQIHLTARRELNG